MLRHMGHSFQSGLYTLGSTLDRHVVPHVRYAAERITEDVAPSIGHALMRAGNQVALRTAEGLQAGAQVIKTKIVPAIEERLVQASNAAVPVINHGLDVLEATIQKSADVVSKSTAKGIDRLSSTVLGEQRHTRVKTIANNIHGGINNGLNNLAGAINNLNSRNTNNNAFTDQDYHDYVISQYDSSRGPQYVPEYPDGHYLPDYPTDYSQYSYQQQTPPKTVGGALSQVVTNGAYTLSRHVLGHNLTDALAPIAKSVSNVVGQTIPAVSLGDGRIVIDLPNTDIERDDSSRSCTTPVGEAGLCKDLSDCPNLILDLTNLRKSVCFKSLFVPGVCCPIRDLDLNSVQSPSSVTSRPRPVTVPTQRPQPLPPVPGTSPRPVPIQPIAEVAQPNFECGQPKIPTFRVVGGDESRRGQWPWVAAVWLHGPKKTVFWCGGSLISKQYVLTAAHCTKDTRGKTFDAQQFSVRLGDHNIFSESDDFISNPQTYRVQSIRPHPEFISHGFYNDVALLKLDRPVDFTEYILPVCLPSTDMARQSLDHMVGQTPSVIGWGSTAYGGHESAVLREVQVPVWKNSDCNAAYTQPITEVFICAGFTEGGRDACQGDSGGPLQLYINGNWIQIGIVSFAIRCAEPGHPGVYTRLTEFLPWIHSNMI
ncbi:proclotting enzyme-like [Penaeus chinensis]|uniref:proclotting enzyme-like n=1 Tax=Penaeus chinensis TaxID=139456 RepID=UPI001FB81097|nr:proclotting enzyme-like [Penaeus chinensis]